MKISLPKNTTLWNTPWITFQNSPINWATWKTKGKEAVNDLVTGNTYISMTEFKESGLPGGAVVKGAVLQRQLCHQSPWVRAQALS